MKILPLSLVFAVAASAGFAQIPYPGNDSDSGVADARGFINPYTGNVSFSTVDIRVSGAVGKYGLQWGRHATSRTSSTQPMFGLGHNWAHSWQWEMADGGTDAQGRSVIMLHEPEGASRRFTETSPGEWWPAPSVKARVSSEGDDFVVTYRDQSALHFKRNHTPEGTIFTLTEKYDPFGNVWTFSWEDGRLVQVAEPAGRWLKISYETLASPTGSAPSSKWTVISRVEASDTQAVSYAYTFPDGTDYPVLASVTYFDGHTAHYEYASPRAGARLLLSKADDPRADRRVRNRSFHYRGEPEAAFGQIAEVCVADGEAVLEALAADSENPRGYARRQTNGAIVYRTFGPGGRLIEEVNALGFSKRREYDADGRGFLVARIDELGHATRFENDALGNPIKVTSADGSTRSWRRDAQGRVLVETDELEHTHTFTRDANGRVTSVLHPDGSSEHTTYNPLGQVLTRTNRGFAATTFTYDERGVLTKVTNALGYSTSRTYDALDRIVSVTDPRGNTTRYERDAAGRVVRTVYADGATRSVDYDRWGQAIRTVDPSGSARTTVYDAFGRAVSRFDALGHETRMEYAAPGEGGASFGRPVRTISPGGRIATIAYDPEGRVIALTTAVGTPAAATTRYDYDAAGRLTSLTNPRGKGTRFFHDERGRRIRTMTALDHATTYTFDAAGRKLSETDAKGNTTRWTRDTMGREVARTDAEGHVIRREYNAAGRLAALIDPKGNTYRFEYDLLGRQTALVYPDGSRETTAYDAVTNKISTVNRAGVVRSFAYDSRNREIRSDWSDGSQTIIKAYDAAGRMTLADNRVSRITFTYDEIGRLASEMQDLYPIVTGGSADPEPQTVSYTYNEEGRKDLLAYPDGSFVSYTYNERGQLQDILADGIPPPIASYEYDLAGNATRMPRENLTATEREFDDENRMTAVVDYDPALQPILEHDYTYDEVGNRTSTAVTDHGARIHRSGDNGTTDHRTTIDTYQYDATYQVTGADYATPVGPSGAVTEEGPARRVRFHYDVVGNRIEVDDNGEVTRYSANALNQYTQVGEFAPTYDRNGNLASMGEWLYRYDAMNRLIEASDGRMTARFWYDAKNRCVARSYNGSVTLNTYDNWNLIEERSFDSGPSTFDQSAKYVHGRRVDEIVLIVNRHGTFYPHHDVLGNVTMLTDAAGQLVERYNYSVDGAVSVHDQTGKKIPNSSVGNRWMFTGRERLVEIGLYDFRNRSYSVELGRFTQTDPVRFSAGDINIYRYVNNSFIAFIDPYGLAEVAAHGESGTIGHAWISVSYEWNGNQIDATVGFYDTGVQDDSHRTADGSLSFEVSDADARDAHLEMLSNNGNDYVWHENNCVDAMSRSLDVAGIDHPSFDDGGISHPNEVVEWTNAE